MQKRRNIPVEEDVQNENVEQVCDTESGAMVSNNLDVKEDVTHALTTSKTCLKFSKENKLSRRAARIFCRAFNICGFKIKLEPR